MLLENKARREGFEPPSPCGHWISNPTPCRAGPPPLSHSQYNAGFKAFVGIGDFEQFPTSSLFACIHYIITSYKTLKLIFTPSFFSQIRKDFEMYEGFKYNLCFRRKY